MEQELFACQLKAIERCMDDLCSISLSGGIFILVIFILRLLLKQRVPRTAFAVLWVAAIFRLLCPVSLPFAASVWRLAENQPSDTKTALLSDHMQQMAVGKPVSSTWELSQILYLAVAVFVLASIGVLYVRSLGKGRKGERIDKGVYLCRGLASPQVCGILRPRILLPYGIREELLPYILLHERIHVLRFDNLWKLLALVAAAVHWFNPAVWIMVILLSRDLEVSCDEWVLGRLREEEKSSYALSLIAVAERCKRCSPLICGFSQNPLEERIRCIMTSKKSIAALCAAAIMILGTTAVFATDAPADKGADPATDKVMVQQGTDDDINLKDLKPYTAGQYEDYASARMEELKNMLEAGELSQENYDRAATELKADLENIKEGDSMAFHAVNDKGETVEVVVADIVPKSITPVEYK